LRDAQAALRRATEKDDNSDEAAHMMWVADVVRDRIITLYGDLNDAIEGETVPSRVELYTIGKPAGADSGGGFGHRALQALAVCREAWGGADHNNAPRMEKAMAWIARTWLETCGYQRAGVIRAVLGHGFDRPDRIIAAVNAAMRDTSVSGPYLLGTREEH
jgi:hypothetical protein